MLIKKYTKPINSSGKYDIACEIIEYVSAFELAMLKISTNVYLTPTSNVPAAPGKEGMPRIKLLITRSTPISDKLREIPQALIRITEIQK